MDLGAFIQLKQRCISPENNAWKELQSLGSTVQHDFATVGYVREETFYHVATLRNNGYVVEKLEKTPFGVIKALTKCYALIQHPDKDMETRIKIHILLGIPWIGFQSASAIMALHNPDTFGILHPVSYAAAFGKEKHNFSIGDYMKYQVRLQELSHIAECSVLAADFTLWNMGVA